MAGETSDGGTVPSAEVPGPEWLIDIIKEQHERLTGKTEKQADEQRTRLMTRADKTQRESNRECFDPLVVSLGPFHHGKRQLQLMESYKRVSALWFISLATGKPAIDITETESNVYQKFIEKVNFSPGDCYADHESFYESKYQSASEDLMPMMFLDGCFILHFIHRVVNGWSDDLSNSSHHPSQKKIVSDMFLLENQIPFPILESLMSLLPDQEVTKSSIIKFITTVFLPSFEMNFSRFYRIDCLRVIIWIIKLFYPSVWWNLIFSKIWKRLFEDAGREPLHLLHVLREVLLGVRGSPDSAGGSAGYWNYYFRPIRELEAAGIQVRRSSSVTLNCLKFKRGLFNSHLEIPQITVDGSTKTHLLNLAAYEMCPDGPEDHTVTSYICLLDSLIDHAEDVDALQSKKILLNNLGSGEDVSNLFKELAANLSPDSNAYAHVIKDIEEHYKRHLHLERTRIGEWMSQFKRTYFTSPWTLISLIAAVSVIALTLLQTIYTMWAFYKTY